MTISYTYRGPKKRLSRHLFDELDIDPIGLQEMNERDQKAYVKRQYYKKARKTHPDKNLDKGKESELAFNNVKNAFELLSDPNERAEQLARFKSSTGTLYDESLTYDEGTEKLKEFFNLLYHKRGYGISAIKELEVFQRESNINNNPCEDFLAWMRNVEKENSYLAWHYIEVELAPLKEKVDGEPDDFLQCLNTLTNNSAGIYFELREARCCDEFMTEYYRFTIDVYLNNVSLLDAFIHELMEEEDAFIALKTAIDQKIAQNNQDVLALAAQAALNQLDKASASGIQVNVIAYHIKQALINPTIKNIEQLKETLLRIRLGKRQLGLTILGSVIAFIGIACFAAGLCSLILTGAGTPVGICLLAVGINLLVTALASIYIAREKGLRSSVHRFFEEAKKVAYDDSPPIQEELLSIDEILDINHPNF